jgi:predicted RNA binding protein YcfA (HicA-like mRNA interferase family)
MKVCDVLKLLEADGWRVLRTTGSHRQLKHPTKPGTVTIAGKPNVDIPPGTLNSIFKQAGLKQEREGR